MYLQSHRYTFLDPKNWVYIIVLLPKYKTLYELLEYYASLGLPLKFMQDNPGWCVVFLAYFLRGFPVNYHSTIARYLSITVPEACSSPKKALRFHKG
jgi:hypothetical protein